MSAQDEIDNLELAFLARQIANNKQLKHIVKQAQPELRQGVYDAIVPHLNFKPKPFWLINA